jgi:hypothetical protein|tara:strand:+ start:97 stop:393 length:297 start_codon:yes stop_codon:yes gene_type:complete
MSKPNPNIDRLISNLEKKFQTTMIGSLARFEEAFAFLWEDEHPDRLKFEDKWEYTRNSILNNGNKQLRGAINDILKFLNTNQVDTKYHYKFYFNQDED